jgi:hypothetical protein
MYLCILDAQGQVVLHRNVRAEPAAFFEAVAPFREGLVVAAECIFTWYWLADLCAKEGIPFVLGHALYMKTIHGGKAKNDHSDAFKIVTLLRGGMPPRAYVYPEACGPAARAPAPSPTSPDARRLGSLCHSPEPGDNGPSRSAL